MSAQKNKQDRVVVLNPLTVFIFVVLSLGQIN